MRPELPLAGLEAHTLPGWRKATTHPLKARPKRTAQTSSANRSRILSLPGHLLSKIRNSFLNVCYSDLPDKKLATDVLTMRKQTHGLSLPTCRALGKSRARVCAGISRLLRGTFGLEPALKARPWALLGACQGGLRSLSFALPGAVNMTATVSFQINGQSW